MLLNKDGLEEFEETMTGLDYRPAFAGARKKFLTAENNIPIEIITSGEFPGDGLPKPVRFPEPNEFAIVIDGVNTIPLEKLIELKLTSGMTAGDRLKDLADVQELIKLKGRDRDFAGKLNEFVRAKYIELLEAVSAAKDRPES